MPSFPRVREERGFTFLEILVVMLIIGILAAIALPVFADQRDQAHDANAKANAGGLATLMETCFVDDESYAPCSPDRLDTTGLPTAPGARDRVWVVRRTASTYEVRSRSLSARTFTIRRTDDGFERRCTPPGEGGCRADRTW